MKPITDYFDYKEFLLEVFQARLEKNARYSLRAFSRDIGLRPSAISDIMNNRHGLSSAAAKDIAERLKLEGSEAVYFINLVDMKHGRSLSLRESAEIRVRKIRNALSHIPYETAQVTLLDHWYLPPILEVVSALGEVATAAEIARRMDLDLQIVEEGLFILEKLQKIKKEGERWLRLSTFNQFDSTTPSETVRTFHRKYLALAGEAVGTQEIAVRKSITTVFAVSTDNLPEARSALSLMSDQFVERFDVKDKPDAVYALAIHMFRVDKE